MILFNIDQPIVSKKIFCYPSRDMNLSIKRIDKTLPLPQYHTPGSVAFDFYARKEVKIAPFSPVVVPTNLIIKVPKGHFLMIASRSSVPIKKGLILSGGVIDQDYHGDEDEIGVVMINITNKTVTVEKGERIAQGLLIKISTVEKFIEKTTMAKKSRGGFGSTGK